MQTLSKRLKAVADLVKPGSAIADIGTDHGYIPVYLCANGIIASAVASDVNEGPLASCRMLVEQENMQSKIKICLSNGFDNLCCDDFDTIIIAGMGGELIADILSHCKDIKQKHIILNPMTHPELARKFLFDNGFEIINDFIIYDAKHYYSVFDAEYTGKTIPKSRADYYLGNINDFTYKEYFLHLLSYLKNKSKSGEDFSDIITALEEKL